MTTALAVVLLAFLIGTPALCRRLRARRDDARLFDEHGTEFFVNTKPLFEDPDTPIEVLRVLRAIGWCVSNKRGPARVYHIFSDPKKLLEFSDDERRVRKVITEFLASRPELEKRYMTALWHGLLAISYRSPLYGRFIRDHLVGIETSERKQDVAFAIKSEAGDQVSDSVPLPVAA